MSFKKNIDKIGELLTRLSGSKTDQERLFLLLKIKLLVEVIEQPVRKRIDKGELAYAAKTRIIKKPLKQFLTALDKISTKHEEVGDSDVGDRMYAAIYRSFIQPQPGYALPAKFGMFSDKGNDLVRAALHEFLAHPDVLAASGALKSSEDRFSAFQDGDVQTPKGTTFHEYFGYSNKVRVP